MFSRSRLLGALSSAVLLASCRSPGLSGPESTPREEGPVQAYAALTTIPIGTACLRFTSTPVPPASNGRTYQQLVSVTPGAPANVPMRGLPFGVDLSITAEAFDRACIDVTDKSLASWLSDSPAEVNLTYGQIVPNLAFKMRPTGGANTSIDFLFFTLAPLTQAFGSGLIGEPTQAGTQTFTLTNAGTTPTGTVSMVITGPHASSFQVMSNTCATALPAGGICRVALRCVPRARGALNASLQLGAVPGGTLSATLSATGLSPATLSINPSPTDFRTVAIGRTVGPFNFTLTNAGDLTSGIPNISIAATVPAGSQNQFDLLAGTNTCNAPLNAGKTCTFQVTFAPRPGIPSGSKASTLRASATPGGESMVTLTGLAAAVPGITITPASHTFRTPDGSIPVAERFVVRNISGVTLGPIEAVLSGANPADFSLSLNECKDYLPPDGSCNLYYSAMPVQPGVRTANLTVTALAGITAQASFTVTAPALLIPSRTSIAFGTHSASGPPVGEIIRLTNNGLVALPGITFNADPNSIFTATGCRSSLEPGRSCEITVSFYPPPTATTRNHSFTFQGTSNPANKFTISVTGTGTP